MSGRGKAKETFPESAELGCPLAELGSRGSLLVPAKPGGLWNVWLITRVPQPRLGSHVGLALPEQVLGDSEGAELEAEQSSAEQSTRGCPVLQGRGRGGALAHQSHSSHLPGLQLCQGNQTNLLAVSKQQPPP